MRGAFSSRASAATTEGTRRESDGLVAQQAKASEPSTRPDPRSEPASMPNSQAESAQASMLRNVTRKQDHRLLRFDRQAA